MSRTHQITDRLADAIMSTWPASDTELRLVTNKTKKSFILRHKICTVASVKSDMKRILGEECTFWHTMRSVKCE